MSSTAPHQAIYRRWRAQTFSEIVGQEAVVATLRNAVRAGRVSHAILFVGPRGTGKTSLARILAKALNCSNLQDGDPCDRCPACVAIREGTTLDVVEIDAASNRGINEVRELRDRLQYAPVSLRRKVYILDEAHQITRDAWNALLKSLEEPPEFVVFMFASTHPQDFPPAILSRLQRFDVRRLTIPEIEGKLRRILEADGRGADPGALRLIARLAAGGMRDAESMLDQLLSSVAGPLAEPAIRELLGLAEADAVERFTAALVGRDPAAGIAILDELEDRGRDLRSFVDQIVEEVRGSLIGGLGQVTPNAQHHTARVSAARRLAAIDPGRSGPGGLRLQLELALFDEPDNRAPRPTGGSSRPIAQAPGSPVEAMPEPATASVAPPAPASPTVEAVSKPIAGTPIAGPPSPPDRSEPDAQPVLATRRPRAAEAATADRGPRPTGPADTLPAGAPPDSAPAGSALPPDDLARLEELWPQIVAHISAHPPTRPLIVACRPVSVDGSIVTLGFPEDQAFLKDVAIRRRPNLESGIAQFLGHPVTVKCVATNLDSPGTATRDADAAFLLAEARRIFADDIVDLGEVR